jgi:hypothetical protein
MQKNALEGTMLGLVLLGAATGASAGDGPVQLVVRAAEAGKCSASLDRQDLRTALPDAQFVYKSGTEPGQPGPSQSCEITVRKDTLLARFSYCALALASDDNGTCAVSFNAEGGRDVEFVAVSKAGKPVNPATCSFVCMVK